MERIKAGMTVLSIDDRVLGVVTAVNRCCFRFELEDRSQASATWDGVYNVQHTAVSLIYNFREPHRYPCAEHRPATLAPAGVRRTGYAVGAGPFSNSAASGAAVESVAGRSPAGSRVEQPSRHAGTPASV